MGPCMGKQILKTEDISTNRTLNKTTTLDVNNVVDREEVSISKISNETLQLDSILSASLKTNIVHTEPFQKAVQEFNLAEQEHQSPFPNIEELNDTNKLDTITFYDDFSTYKAQSYKAMQNAECSLNKCKISSSASARKNNFDISDIVQPMIQTRNGNKQFKTVKEITQCPPKDLIIFLQFGEFPVAKEYDAITTSLNFSDFLQSIKSGMINIPVMGEEVTTLEESFPTPKFLITREANRASIIPIDITNPLLPLPASASINELGKQLLKAAGEGNVEEIKLLMTRGAPFTADWLGTSPLHLAAQNNHLTVCEILLRAGISRDARTKVDRTPLHMAAYEGHIDVVECLLKNGADYDCKDLLGMTPLHWAAQNGHADIATLLIRYGAQTDISNKFDLLPVDIAVQIKRLDIIEIITMAIRDPLVATQHLTLQMSVTENSNDSTIEAERVLSVPSSPLPIETVLLEDLDGENSIDPERLHITQSVVESDVFQEESNENQDTSYSESIKILQQHGITMLPADDTNILTSIMENGHSVVLTEVGKQVLNSTKPPEAISTTKHNKGHNSSLAMRPKKVITVTPQEFLAMTSNLGQNNFLKQINGKLINNQKQSVKRIVMKKSKVIPISPTPAHVKLHKMENTSDVESLMKQLIEAKKLVEEYKQKFIKKEAEAERYKQQLNLITQGK